MADTAPSSRCSKCEIPLYLWVPPEHPFKLLQGWAKRADGIIYWCPRHTKKAKP